MAQRDKIGLDRREAMCAMAAGIGVPLLAACGSDGASAGSGGDAPAAGPIAKTSEIPVGGGVVLADKRIVVTQPTEGEFIGYPNVCTHQGGPITSVSDKGVMTCSLHGSQFSIEDGQNIVGPNGKAAGTTADLREIPLTVEGDDIIVS